MLSQTAEYALRAAVYLASVSPEVKTAVAISEVVKIPVPYLSKVLQNLAKGGIVASQRGLHGGFSLARQTSEISVLDVVNCVDNLRRPANCPLGIPEHTGLCPLHRRLDDAISQLQRSLGQTTLAAMLEPAADGIIPLLGKQKTVRKRSARPLAV
jgi:Rrf2 family protein